MPSSSMASNGWTPPRRRPRPRGRSWSPYSSRRAESESLAPSIPRFGAARQRARCGTPGVGRTISQTFISLSALSGKLQRAASARQKGGSLPLASLATSSGGRAKPKPDGSRSATRVTRHSSQACARSSSHPPAVPRTNALKRTHESAPRGTSAKACCNASAQRGAHRGSGRRDRKSIHRWFLWAAYEKNCSGKRD
jgi:hypothetical protein